MGITFLFSVMSGVMSRCDRMAANADTTVLNGLTILRCWRSVSSTVRFPANLLRCGTRENRH
jgi:mannose/fructose/N-acetylgalactosamine-specific phosphotransferase system component IIC